MSAPESERSVPTPSGADLAAMFESLKNWGRWGADDQSGALNHLAPAHRRAAAALLWPVRGVETRLTEPWLVWARVTATRSTTGPTSCAQVVVDSASSWVSGASTRHTPRRVSVKSEARKVRRSNRSST